MTLYFEVVGLPGNAMFRGRKALKFRSSMFSRREIDSVRLKAHLVLGNGGTRQ